MSDDISIPMIAPHAMSARTAYTHSYRARRNGLDAGTKILMLAAAGLAVLLAGGMVVWTLGGHQRPAGVPTVAADRTPLRIKPDNAGGMTLLGLNDVAAEVAGAGDLAPAAEQPDPQALLAQRRRPPTTAETAAPAAPASPPPLIATPIVASGVAHAGGIMVQLAAVASEKGAAAEWQRLVRRMPAALRDRQLVTQKAELGGKTVWRVRTGGFGDVADAAQFCKLVRAKGTDCSLASF